MEHTWCNIQEAVQQLASKIKDSGETFDAIVAVGRGGMIPAAMIAHQLGIKRCDYVNYSRKTGLIDDTTSGLHGMNVLFIDDATETGGTFKFLHDTLFQWFDRTPHTAVLFMNDNCEVPIDYYADTFVGDAPVMPWELKNAA